MHDILMWEHPSILSLGLKALVEAIQLVLVGETL